MGIQEWRSRNSLGSFALFLVFQIPEKCGPFLQHYSLYLGTKVNMQLRKEEPKEKRTCLLAH